MQTQTVRVLWVNLCVDTKNAQDTTVICEIKTLFNIKLIDKEPLPAFIEEINPHIICLDYDFPDRQSLLLLRQLRFDYPNIPILMITTQHCESLAVWAFRTGVRDYLVKPLSTNTIIEVLDSLAKLAIPATQNRRAPRQNIFIPPLLPNEFRHTSPDLQIQRTALAFCYVEAHFNEKIAEEDLAT